MKSKKTLLALAAAGAVALLLPFFIMQAGMSAITAGVSTNFSEDDEDQCTTAVSSNTSVNPALVAALSGNANAAELAQALLEGKGVDLKGLSFTRSMVAGIIGNFYVESGVTFARAEKTAGNSGQMDNMSNDAADSWSKGGPRGLGIAQWTWNPGRAGNLINVARSKNANWYDGDVQVQLIVDELASGYMASVYVPLKATTTPEDAARLWLTKYEGIGTGTLPARQAAAKSALDALNSLNIGATQISYSGGGTTTDLVWHPTGGRVRNVKDCGGSGTTTASTATMGAVGGAPTTRGDYSWMCNTDQHVCKNGDAGAFYAHLEYGYQCVWYAWNRLAMIHGSTGWNWVVGDGGQIANNVKGKAGWTVSDTPKPGDGASGTSKPFAGTTHVAVVEEVQPDATGWKVRLSEGNFCTSGGSGCWAGYSGTRWLTKADMGGVQFFRNASWK